MKIKRISFDAVLLFIAAAILPIYVFKSGGIQPAHAMFAVFAALTLVKRGFPTTNWSVTFTALILHSILVEAFYTMLGGEAEFMINSVFFLYNFVLVTAVYQYVSTNGLSTLVPGITIAAAAGLTSVLISGVSLREWSDAGRGTGTFNNPNQLGFFSVCLLSLSYLFYRVGSIGYWIALGLFAVSIFLSVASLSKAAMVANFFVVIFALKPASSRNSLIVWAVGITIGVLILVRMFQDGRFDEYLFVDRLLAFNTENDSSLESRGYFAILEGNWLQLLFGLGGQGVDDIVGHEVHSTFGSILNKYGLFGFFIFCAIYFIWSIRVWKFYGFSGLVCLVGPATLYGITHNGTRFTIFWLLFATSLGMIKKYQAESRQVSTRITAVPDLQLRINKGFS